MTRLYVDGPTLLRAVRAATRNLERHVDEVDALNVFPVPDGDTGSNMLATMRASLAEAERVPETERDLHTVAEALSRGALTGARGNSGVILSQIIRGMTAGADGRRRANGVDLATGLRRASESAYRSVLTPVEGTILTVIRDTAEAAELAAGRQPHVEAVLAEAIEAAAVSVQRTPTLLPVLEDAGVVDSGGQGLFRVLEGMLQVDGSLSPTSPRRSAAVTLAALPASSERPMGDGATHGYETQYIVRSATGGIDVVALREAIQGVGDSVVVAGDAALARVHVHGERPDAALAAGLRWGRLEQVEILDLDAQVAGDHGHGARPSGHAARSHTRDGQRAAASRSAPAGSTALVAVTRGPGIASVFESLGVHVVVPGHGTRPSVGEVAEGVLAAGAREVIVLPNDRDAVLAAAQAVALVPDVRVEVIPTRNAAEGIAAAICFDAAASLADNVAAMSAEASTLRSFRVFTAARDAVVDGTPVRHGQVLALDGARHLLAFGAEVEAVTLQALATCGDFELVTLYVGHSGDERSSSSLRETIELAGFDAEVEIIDGGQPHDHLLVAVE